MEKLKPSELLEVWEQGFAGTPLERALLILNAASPGESWEALARLSIGARDVRLLKLREQTFGSSIQALCDCPRCGKPLELSLDIKDILHDQQMEDAESQLLSRDGYDMRFRLPNSLDLAAVAGITDQPQAVRQLLDQCLIEVRHKTMAVTSDALPSILADAVASHIAKADPQADIELEMTCPDCHHAWLSAFDIAAFFWIEISARAERLLHDVHVLALAYGWSEGSILTLSPLRRQAYLEMVGG